MKGLTDIKKIKKIISTVILSLAIASTLAFNVYAANRSYTFNLSSGGAEFTTGNAKDDAAQYAVIYTNSGNLSSSSFAWFSLWKEQNTTSTNKISGDLQCTSYARFTLNYSTYRSSGTTSYLRANAGFYGVNVSGSWWS